MNKDVAYYRLGYKIFADLTGTIAIPAVLAALSGKWLDTRYNSSPRYILIFLFLAFLFTAFLIVKKAKKYKEEYERAINLEKIDG